LASGSVLWVQRVTKKLPKKRDRHLKNEEKKRKLKKNRENAHKKPIF